MPSPPRPTAVEYYYDGYGHYFVTASPPEIAALDGGRFPGWARTGQSFGVFDLDTAGAANVCRFWSGQTFAPKSSHFYTPFDFECAYLKQQGVWQYEGDAFALVLPDAAGNCGSGSVPLYRLYNNGQTGAPNHRFTTSLTTRAEMLAQGWIAEGSGHRRDGLRAARAAGRGHGREPHPVAVGGRIGAADGDGARRLRCGHPEHHGDVVELESRRRRRSRRPVCCKG